MNTPTKTCRRCLGRGKILVNSGTGRTEPCPKCGDHICVMNMDMQGICSVCGQVAKLNGQKPCPPEPTK